MEIQQFHYFLIAAKYEHMTKAAEILHIAQPALSQSIQRLETELGVKLFNRKGRNIALNDYGRLLQKRLRPIMSAIEQIPLEFAEVSHNRSYPIRLHVAAGTALMTEFLIRYQERHPGTAFQLTQEHEHDDWDIALTTSAFHPHDRLEKGVFTEEIFLGWYRQKGGIPDFSLRCIANSRRLFLL